MGQDYRRSQHRSLNSLVIIVLVPKIHGVYNPLTYITTARINATGLRWEGELSDFKFDMKYRPGHNNRR
jgi:hypothetical protein